MEEVIIPGIIPVCTNFFLPIFSLDLVKFLNRGRSASSNFKKKKENNFDVQRRKTCDVYPTRGERK